MARNQQGSQLLVAMKALGSLFGKQVNVLSCSNIDLLSSQIEELWNAALPRLSSHLDNSNTTSTFKQAFWDEQLLRLFSATTDAAGW